MDPFMTALALTAFAGAATFAGGLLGVLGREPGQRSLGLGLGMAAGVMLSVSFLELVPEAIAGTQPPLGSVAPVAVLVGFASGLAGYALLDSTLGTAVAVRLPGASVEDGRRRAGGAGPSAPMGGVADRRLLRVGFVTALGIGLHNLPEGFATFAATIDDPHVGLALAAAMAVHNVPEGLAVAVPVRRATGSRRSALLWAGLTAAAEPLGALVGWLVLAPFVSDALLGLVFAVVAGIMVAISLDNLLPTARAGAGRRITLIGFMLGVSAMVLSLQVLS